MTILFSSATSCLEAPKEVISYEVMDMEEETFLHYFQVRSQQTKVMKLSDVGLTLDLRKLC